MNIYERDSPVNPIQPLDFRRLVSPLPPGYRRKDTEHIPGVERIFGGAVDPVY